jgi:hypothetical protein
MLPRELALRAALPPPPEPEKAPPRDEEPLS